MRIVMLVSKRTDPRTFNEAYTLVNAGHEVTILTWDRELRFPKKEEVIEGYKMHRIQFKGTYGRGIGQIPGFARFWFVAFLRLMRWKYEVVYCHDLDTYPLGWLAGPPGRKEGASLCEGLEATFRVSRLGLLAPLHNARVDPLPLPTVRDDASCNCRFTYQWSLWYCGSNPAAQYCDS